MSELIDKNTISGFESSLPSQTDFTYLHNKYRRPIVSYFKRKLPKSDEWEDMAQQVFINLAKAMRHPEFIFSQNLIYVIARNVLIDHIRWRKSREIDNHDVIDDNIINDDLPSAEKTLHSKQKLDRFFDHVDNLPLRCKQVFILHRVKHMSQQDIADRLGISRSTVQKHMMNAMAKLQSSIGSMENL